MFKHYLKITFQNILRNKLRYLITTLGIAVGLVVLSMCWFCVDCLPSNGLSRCNNYHQMAIMEQGADPKKGFSSMCDKALIEKLERQKLPGVEKMAKVDVHGESVQVRSDSLPAVPYVAFIAVTNKEYFDVFSIKFIEGGVSGWNGRQAVLTKPFARKLFGYANPIGRTIEVKGNQYQVVGIVRNNAMLEYTGDIIISENQITNNRYPKGRVILKLASDADLKLINKQLKVNITKPLSSVEKTEYVRLIPAEDYNSFRLPVKLLMTFLASLVLIGALINFFTLLLESVLSRIRQFTLRKIMGSDAFSLFALLMCEIVPVLLISLLFNYCLSELVIQLVIPDLIPERLIDYVTPFLDNFYIVPLQVMGWVALAYILMVFVLVVKIQRIILVQGIRGKLVKAGTHRMRNVLLGVQLVISFFLVAMTSVILLIAKHEMSKIYYPLSNSESECIFNVSLHQFNQREQAEMLSKIKQIAGVTNILPIDENKDIDNENAFTTQPFPHYKKDSVQVLVQQKSFDGNYIRFFDHAPASGLRTLAPREAIVNAKLSKEIGSDTLRDGDKTYKIIAVLDNIPFCKNDDPVALTGYTSTESYSGVYVKCQPGTEKEVKTKLMGIIRVHFPESIPYTIHSLSEELDVEFKNSFLMILILIVISFVSLVVSVYGIYAAVTVDTHKRRKEIAIRKINGATKWNVFWLHSKLYFVLLVVSSLIAFSVAFFIMNAKLIQIGTKVDYAPWRQPLFWILLFIILGLFVFSIIFVQIQKAIKENPAEVVKSE